MRGIADGAAASARAGALAWRGTDRAALCSDDREPDTIRDLLEVKQVHAIGYCVAGTTLAATLAILAAKGEAAKVKSATFFTAQVDFSRAGDLLNFIDDAQLKLIESLVTDGYLAGRYLALSFNLIRGKDLIWSTVVSNYLLGQDYPAFDLLHWNGDVTNLPAKWHRAYLCDLYRDNKLVQPDALSALGVPIDLTRVETPAFVQAGREDHISPLESVWKIRDQFRGPLEDQAAVHAPPGHGDVLPVGLAERGSIEIVARVVDAHLRGEEEARREERRGDGRVGLDPGAFQKLCGLLQYVDGDYKDPKTLSGDSERTGFRQAPGPLLGDSARPLRGGREGDRKFRLRPGRAGHY